MGATHSENGFLRLPTWAVPSLNALIASDIDVAAWSRTPTVPAGEGMEMHATPVKEAAVAAGHNGAATGEGARSRVQGVRWPSSHRTSPAWLPTERSFPATC